ncbi:MAG TPA: Gfo/Idh/MocA family oxidoreductase [Planctomicrobium sp.]|nr:Gfo/Idh/MocA family oxidoreductase [Planctomicrobium sp.]
MGRIGVAVLGIGYRGSYHANDIASRSDAEVLYLCDPDTAQAGPRQSEVEGKQGRSPQIIQDFRRVLDDSSVDAVVIATPNHWHALMSILAMQAGKHVYVEKPVSHNVWEGRQIVNWARRTNRICQTGTQCRSSVGLQQAVQWVRDGNLGTIQHVIGTCYNPRKSIGKVDQPISLPKTLDYGLWCGPAAVQEIFRTKFHYDWHWDFNTGNGDMGNQGIHQMDIARWFLGESKLSSQITSIGGRFGYRDAGNTPNTQIVYHHFDSAPIIFETRGLPRRNLDYSTGMDQYRGSQVGVVVQCEHGHVLVPSYTSATAFRPDGEIIQHWDEGGDHFGNFISAIRSGNHQDLNADILEGHLSSALCHTGSICHLIGKESSGRDMEKMSSDDLLWKDSCLRMTQHLKANGVDFSALALRVGPSLTMDSLNEVFMKNSNANRLLTRDYRKGYVVDAP